MTQAIGIVVNGVKGPITAQNQQGHPRPLTQGDPVYLHDTLITAAQSYIKIKFNDGTLLQLGPSSQARLDQYTYEPHGAEGKFQASIFSGIFHYISGKLTGHHHGEHSKIITPSANIGIRGSEIEAQIGADGSTTILHLDGVISVTSRYIAQTEEVAYERGVTIYIPAEALTPLISKITEEKIEEYQHQQWSALGTTTVTGVSEEIYPEILTQSPHTSLSEEIIHFRPPPSEGRPPPFSAPGERYEERPDQVLHEGLRDEFPRMMDNLPRREGEPFKYLDQESKGPPHPREPFLGENDRFPPKESLPGDYEISRDALKPEGPDIPKPPGIPHIPVPDDPGKEHLIQDIQLQEDELKEDITDPRGKIAHLNELPLHGQVRIDDEEETLTYTPDENFYGTDQITYLLEDGRSGTLNIIIEPVNDPPVIKENNTDIQEDTQNYVFWAEDLLRDHVVDVEGDRVNIVQVLPIVSALEVKPDLGVVQLLHGNVHLVNEQGDIAYTPQANFNGQEEFAYLVQDSQGATSIGKIVVTVLAVNDPPEAGEDPIHLNNLLPVVLSTDQLIKNDFDVEGDKLQITSVLNSVNGEVDFKQEEITFTPSINFTQGGFDYVVSDGEKTDTGHVSLAFENITTPSLFPIAEEDILVTHTAAPIHILPIQLLRNDLDPEHLTIIQVQEARHGQVNLDDQGNVIFTPDAQFTQTETGGFMYQVSDGKGHTDLAWVTINLGNSPPQAYEDFFTIPENTPLVIAPLTLLSNDQDVEGDPLSIISVINGANGTVAFDQQGHIVFTPSEEFVKYGFGTFNYQVSDGNKAGNQASVTVNFVPSPSILPPIINHTPIANDDQVFIGHYQRTSFDISFDELLGKNDSDPDQEPLSIIGVNQGLNGQVILGQGGNIEFIPTADFIQQGKGQFTYKISDGRGGTDEATVDLTIQPIGAGDDVIETHDFITFPIEHILKNDSSGVRFLRGYNSLNGNLNVQEGKIEFTPSDHFFAERGGQFTYEVKDSYGNIAHAKATLILKNTPPVAHDGKIEIDNGKILTLDDLREPLGISDLDGDTLQITRLTFLEGDHEVVLQEGKIAFTQALTSHDLRDTDHLLITIDDGHGGITQATVAVYRNIPPLAENDDITTTKNQPLLISVLPNDFDINLGDTIVLNTFSQPLSGTVTQKGEQLLFEPANNFTGTVSWTYTIKDNHSAVSQDATVKVTVTNRLPEAQNDPLPNTSNLQEFRTFQDTSLSIPKQELLNNDKDPDPNDPPKIIDAKALQGTESVLLTGDQVTFKPTPGFTGEASFTYTIVDQSNAQDDAIVTIHVMPHLMAIDDTLPSMLRNTELFISGKEKLLSNDTPSTPYDNLIILHVDQPINGSVELLDVQGNIKFTPTPDFSGLASFKYTVQDNWGQTDQATASIEVINTNKAPVITLPTTPLMYSGEQLNIASGATVVDSDSLNFDQGSLQVTLPRRSPSDILEIQSTETQGGVINVSSPAGGMITFNGTPMGDFSLDVVTGRLLVNLNDQANEMSTSTLLQAITYRNTAPAEGPSTVEFTLTDGDGGTSQLVSREISMGNVDPVAGQDFLSRDFNVSTVISTAELLSNDKDPNPIDNFQVTEVNSLNNEVNVELVGNEVQLFIDGLVNGHFDSVIFNYTISDGRGGNDSSEVTVTPTNVIKGDSGENGFQGTAKMDIFLGEGGNDTFTSSEGRDILLGGEGDDLFLLNPNLAKGVTFLGGEGKDTLRFEGITDTFIDITNNNQLSEVEKFNVQEIEVLDLSGKANQLKLGLQEVLDISSQNHLTIEGDDSNMVSSTGQGWSNQGLQGAYYLYTAGQSGAELLVNKDIVQLIS